MANTAGMRKKNLTDQCDILDQNFKVVEQERQTLEVDIADSRNTQASVLRSNAMMLWPTPQTTGTL